VAAPLNSIPRGGPLLHCAGLPKNAKPAFTENVRLPNLVAL
jgi:hypothetical protein